MLFARGPLARPSSSALLILLVPLIWGAAKEDKIKNCKNKNSILGSVARCFACVLAEPFTRLLPGVVYPGAFA